MTTLLRLEGLTAGHDNNPVVHTMDLEVAAGEVVALVGPNGAGKTTVLLTVSGLLAPLGGTMEILGEQVGPTRSVRSALLARRARRGLAHVPEDRGLFFSLTTAEHFRLATPARRRHPDAPPPPDLDTILNWFPPLAAVMHRRAGLLSGGEQQMLALAQALRSGPRLLAIDELSLGLAPMAAATVTGTLADIAHSHNVGVLIVEQHAAVALTAADRGYLLAGGRVVASGSGEQLAAQRQRMETGYLGGIPDQSDTSL